MTRSIRFSAFIEDMRVDALPADVQDDLGRFVDAKAHHLLPHYGMVVKELLPKADPANLKTARAHVKTLSKKKAMGMVQEATRAGKKYILLLNDRVIDGHHFLAKAERGGVTSSLNVLDLTPTRFQFTVKPPYVPPQRDQKPKRSHLRTAAIVAGGSGLAYGGVKLGQAAEQLRRTAAVAEHAADNTRAITGAIRSPLRSLRKVVGLSVKSLRKDDIHFAATGSSVAQDRYRKQIKEADTGRAASAYHRSAAAGALLGLALRKPGMTRGKAAGIGALGGAAAQAITRQASATTKDNFGERSPGGKKLDALPAIAIGAGALLAGRKKIAGLRRRTAVKLSSAKKAAPKVAGAFVKDAASNAAAGFFGFEVPGSVFRTSRLKKSLIAGGALAGGITVADTIAAATERKPGQTTTDALAHGAKKGAIYGAALAGSEPFIHSLLKKASTRKVALSAHTPFVFGGSSQIGQKTLVFDARIPVAVRRRVIVREICFGGRQQLRDAGNRYIDPLKVASGEATAHVDGQQVNLPVQHAQVVRAAIHKGQTLHRYGQRTGALLKDAVGAASGQRKTDARGRPQKREWEKSWFKNAVGTAATAGALLGHASLMKRNPGYRRKVAGVVRQGKHAANSVVPDLFPMSVGPVIDVTADFLRFDTTAPDWDVRDQRGRSARVFSPGARPRERREKKPHEKVSFLRKAAVVGAVAAAAGGAALGYRLGKRTSASALMKTAAAPKAWQKPGYRSKKVTVVSKKKFQQSAGE